MMEHLQTGRACGLIPASHRAITTLPSPAVGEPQCEGFRTRRPPSAPLAYHSVHPHRVHTGHVAGSSNSSPSLAIDKVVNQRAFPANRQTRNFSKTSKLTFSKHHLSEYL